MGCQNLQLCRASSTVYLWKLDKLLCEEGATWFLAKYNVEMSIFLRPNHMAWAFKLIAQKCYCLQILNRALHRGGPTHVQRVWPFVELSLSLTHTTKGHSRKRARIYTRGRTIMPWDWRETQKTSYARKQHHWRNSESDRWMISRRNCADWKILRSSSITNTNVSLPTCSLCWISERLSFLIRTIYVHEVESFLEYWVRGFPRRIWALFSTRYVGRSGFVELRVHMVWKCTK